MNLVFNFFFKLEKNLAKYNQNKEFRLSLIDLCLFQATFVMLKPEKFINGNMIDLFQRIIICTLKRLMNLKC